MDETNIMLIYEDKRLTDPTRVLVIDDPEVVRAWVRWCQDMAIAWRVLRADRVTDIPPAVEKQAKLF